MNWFKIAQWWNKDKFPDNKALWNNPPQKMDLRDHFIALFGIKFVGKGKQTTANPIINVPVTFDIDKVNPNQVTLSFAGAQNGFNFAAYWGLDDIILHFVFKYRLYLVVVENKSGKALARDHIIPGSIMRRGTYIPNFKKPNMPNEQDFPDHIAYMQALSNYSEQYQQLRWNNRDIKTIGNVSADNPSDFIKNVIRMIQSDTDLGDNDNPDTDVTPPRTDPDIRQPIPAFSPVLSGV